MRKSMLTVAAALLLPSLARPAPPPPACPIDSVRVGPLCVDKYEASVWEIAASSTMLVRKVKRGTASLTALTNGGATQRGSTGLFSDDYPCGDDGNDCAGKIYAASIAGVPPSGAITWFQAQQACANSGKRLLTNAEWQMAAAGTPDPGQNNGTLNVKCNTDSCGGGTCTPRNTGNAGSTPGAVDSCISSRGVQDMIGNVREWVADWVPRSTGCGDWGTFSNDSMCLLGASATASPEPDTPPGPGALARGGNNFWSPPFNSVPGVFAVDGGFPPQFADQTLGFRCAR